MAHMASVRDSRPPRRIAPGPAACPKDASLRTFGDEVAARGQKLRLRPGKTWNGKHQRRWRIIRGKKSGIAAAQKPVDPVQIGQSSAAQGDGLVHARK